MGEIHLGNSRITRTAHRQRAAAECVSHVDWRMSGCVAYNIHALSLAMFGCIAVDETHETLLCAVQ